MSISRRRFLRSAAVVSAALTVKPSTFALGQNPVWSNTPANPVQSYSREMFERHVGDVFRVRVGNQVVDMKLLALEDSQPVSHGITTGKIARTDCFSLRFQASKQLPGTARIRNLKHSRLGDFDLFMVHSEEGRKLLHTAIVNQLV